MGEILHRGKGYCEAVSYVEWEELDPYGDPVQTGATGNGAAAGDTGARGPHGRAGGRKAKEGSAVKNARLQAPEVERVNRLMRRKLQDIKREPPSTFHAPNGYKSMRGGRVSGRQREAMMQGRTNSKPQREWPPVPDETKLVNRTAQQKEVEQENARMANVLDDMYNVRKDSFVVANELGKGVDLRGRWQERTAIYRGSPSKRGARVSTSSPSPRPLPKSSGVPKTLAVALCAGCGKKSFYGADGKKLYPCDYCQTTLYCSHTCAKVDWQHHKKMCKYLCQGAKKGTWTTATPAEDCWVSNAAMRRGRELLAEKTKRYPDGDATRQIRNEMKAVSLEEAERDGRQREAHRRAYNGLDGPRPCMLED